MADFDYDLFVIGAGSGGVRAARMSAALGARVAIAEDRYLGGTCVNVGCVPKKLLVYAAQFSEHFHHAADFGWQSGPNSFDWQRLIQNKNSEIERLNAVYGRLLDNAGVALIEGRASLLDQHSVTVDGQAYRAGKILIATGGWPHVPEIPGKQHIITSNEAFFLERLPERLTIVGGGYIAVEFAGIFHGLGVETTLVYRGPLFLRGFDHDLRRHLADEMRRKGIRLSFDNNIQSISQQDNAYQCQLQDGTSLQTDLVMYATGRRFKTAELGLDSVGINTNEHGAIIVDDHFQTSVETVYALGDVIDRVQLTPVALAEGMYLAQHLFGNASEPVDYQNIPSAVFSQPNIATVGLTEEQARKDYADIAVFKSQFTPMKFSLAKDGEKTLVKLIVDNSSDRVLGAHMIGPDAGEIIQGIAIAIKADATKSVFDNTIGIHPTTAEEFVTLREPVSD